MAGFLVLADGSRVEVRDGLTLGRVAECDVVLRDTKASRRHARLRVAGSVVEVEDLGSSNGTFLNDKPITRRLLRDGDEIRIGTSTLRFVESAPPPPTVVEPEPELGSSAAAADDEIQVERTPPPSLAEDPYRPGGGLEGDPLAGRPPDLDDVEVLEFVDEVVTVKKRPPAPSARPPEVATAQRGREHGVLTFAKRDRRGGLLGDDLRQMSLARRLLWSAVAAAGALGLGYAVMKLVAAGS